MKRLLLVAAAVLSATIVAAPIGAHPTAALRVTVTAPGHTPKIGVHWPYTVRATLGGVAATGRISAAIVDPVGGVHPVERGVGTRKITRLAFHGSFKDFIIWPASSRGVPLTVRFTVTVGAATKTITYAVTPHA